MVFAQIKNGEVLNTLVLEDLSLIALFFSDPVTCVSFDHVLQVDTMYPRPGIGWTFDGIVFTAPDDQGGFQESVDGTVSLIFSKNSSTMTPGTYLNSGSVAGSNCGQPTLGHTKIVGISVTNTNVAISNPIVFQLQKRINLNEFEDIPYATVVIPVGSYSGNVTFSPNIDLGGEFEISMYLKSGDSPGNPVIQVCLG